MKRDTIVFIAITDYDNLGVGYMASLLSEAGYRTKIIDFRVRKSELLKILKKLDPILVGFSIIFLNNINLFTGLIKYLRDKEINCHFTAGGHYASLRYEELFSLIPNLDSIIRFEGEYPILELTKRLSLNQDWRDVASLSYKKNNKIITNPILQPEKYLDKFPYPSRSPLEEYAFGKKFSAILAGRGCVHNCSFCNTREFYRQANGPLKRIRKPEMVVKEMNYLFDKEDCSVFIFHDDDFPVKSKTTPDWLKRYCDELERNGLNNKIIWKINCRPDDVQEECFSMMKSHGLFLVFLGLEDGTVTGLKRLNKQLEVESNLRSIEILKKLDIEFDYGFMLFQPETTFISLNENLVFLRLICGDGYSPVTFLKLIPLYETRVEKELKESDRLIYTNGIADYHFHEESMDLFYQFIIDSFSEWLRSPDGLENFSRWARNYCAVFKYYHNDLKKGFQICRKITGIISKSNLFLLDTLKELSEFYESGQYEANKKMQDTYKKKIKIKHDYFRKKIIYIMGQLIDFVEDSNTLPTAR